LSRCRGSACALAAAGVALDLFPLKEGPCEWHFGDVVSAAPHRPPVATPVRLCAAAPRPERCSSIAGLPRVAAEASSIWSLAEMEMVVEDERRRRPPSRLMQGKRKQLSHQRFLSAEEEKNVGSAANS